MRRVATAVIVITMLTGCGAGTVVQVPEAGSITAPTFQQLPENLARSPQLAALQPRDTAGIEIEADPLLVGELTNAIAALQASPDAPTMVSSVNIYDTFIGFSYEQGGVNGRTVNASYRVGEDLYVSDPSFNDQETFDLSLVDPAVVVELVDAVAARVPNGFVTGLSLDPDRSYDFGLVWSIDVTDARGTLATVFADVNGAIVAVDQA